MSSLIAKPEPFCQFDEFTYLGIHEVGNELEYFTSTDRQIIPQGIQVKLVPPEDEDPDMCIGIRLFEVYKSGSEYYDIVKVGTLSVVDGTAWIVGEMIASEEPFCDNCVIVPPLACTYPVAKPRNLTHHEYRKEYRTQLLAQMREKLIVELRKKHYNPNDFDLDYVLETSDRGPRNILSGRCISCRYTVKYHDDGMCLAEFASGADLERLAKRLEAMRLEEASKAAAATEELSSSFRIRASINDEGQTV